jgi:hypothetical protein
MTWEGPKGLEGVIRIYISYDVKTTHLHAAGLSLCWYHSSPLSVSSPSPLLYSPLLSFTPYIPPTVIRGRLRTCPLCIDDSR